MYQINVVRRKKEAAENGKNSSKVPVNCTSEQYVGKLYFGLFHHCLFKIVIFTANVLNIIFSSLPDY